MKRMFFLFLLGFMPFIAVITPLLLSEAVTGCGPMGKQLADVVVKKLLAECVAENAHLGDVELQDACKFADDIWPVVRDLVAAQRRGMAKASAARSTKDAGRD